MHGNPTISKKDTLVRIFKTLFSFYPVMMPVVVCCILFSAVISSIPSVFMQRVIALIEAANINIEYLYSFVLTNHNSAKILMRVEDTDRALKILTEKGIKLLSEKIL